MGEFQDLGNENWAGPFTVSGAGAIAASAEGAYAGAFLAATITNNGSRTAKIWTGGITIGADQRLEVVTFSKYTGAVPPTPIIAHYQRVDAFDNRSLNLPDILLKPGERLLIRVFNRAPAAAANVAISAVFYQIEERVYNQYQTKKRAQLEEFGRV